MSEENVEGTTLRNYFAAKAMQGICVNVGRNRFDIDKPDEIAKASYAMADAMLKASSPDSKGFCAKHGPCDCGGDLPAVRAGCSNWKGNNHGR